LSNTLNSTWGNGKFYMNNIFDAEPTDHFMISFLDLGYLRILIEEPGIQATIPRACSRQDPDKHLYQKARTAAMPPFADLSMI